VPKERAASIKAHVGRRVSETRRRQNVQQDKLAERLDVTTQWLSRAENGHENLTIETLTRLANALGIRVVELFQDGGNDPDLPNRVPRSDTRRRRRPK
jgi:transcriptional regulator with XRE-family HTH domain